MGSPFEKSQHPYGLPSLSDGEQPFSTFLAAMAALAELRKTMTKNLAYKERSEEEMAPLFRLIDEMENGLQRLKDRVDKLAEGDPEVSMLGQPSIDMKDIMPTGWDDELSHDRTVQATRHTVFAIDEEPNEKTSSNRPE
ncbi:uncharacterized protein J3R85_003457 [Psidium guajava]|nr:uncharacterized protein J3R85_003457 [Psidium guajava]